MHTCTCLSLRCVPLFVTPWTVAHQAPLSMGFSREEYWNRLPFPFLGDLPHPGFEPGSPALQAVSLPSELPGKPPEYAWSLDLYILLGPKCLGFVGKISDFLEELYAFLPLSLVGYTFLPMRTVFSTGRCFYDIIFYEQIEAELRRKNIGFLLL